MKYKNQKSGIKKNEIIKKKCRGCGKEVTLINKSMANSFSYCKNCPKGK